jgi:hypothetical protein
MKINVLQVSLIVILSLSGCKKNDSELAIKGAITDATSGEGISGVELAISKNGLSSGSFNPTFNLIEKNYSNWDGTYEIVFSNENAGEYKIDLKKSDYLNSSVFLSSEEVLAAQPFILNKSLLPSGLLQVNINNEIPGSADDYISFQLSDYEIPCSCCPVGLMEFSGPVIDYESTCTLPAERWHRYVYYYFKNGSSSTTLDSVWVSRGQTSVLNIDF